MSDEVTAEAANAPVIQVHSPSATAEDIAVVVAVLSAAGGGSDDTAGPDPLTHSQWAGRARHTWSTPGPRF